MHVLRPLAGRERHPQPAGQFLRTAGRATASKLLKHLVGRNRLGPCRRRWGRVRRGRVRRGSLRRVDPRRPAAIVAWGGPPTRPANCRPPSRSLREHFAQEDHAPEGGEPKPAAARNTERKGNRKAGDRGKPAGEPPARPYPALPCRFAPGRAARRPSQGGQHDSHARQNGRWKRCDECAGHAPGRKHHRRTEQARQDRAARGARRSLDPWPGPDRHCGGGPAGPVTAAVGNGFLHGMRLLGTVHGSRGTVPFSRPLRLADWANRPLCRENRDSPL